MTAPTTTTAQAKRHIDGMQPHPDNPRLDIDEKDPDLLELRDSIIEKGVLEPLILTSDGLILAGHRRRVASRLAYKLTGDKKFLEVPVVIRDLKAGEDAGEIMMHENRHRKSLSLVEESRGFYGLMERQNLTTIELARRLSVSVQTVTGRLQIVQLPIEIQSLFDAGLLPVGAAGILVRVDEEDKQRKYANMLARKQMTAAELKEIVWRECRGKPVPAVGPGSQRKMVEPTPKRTPGHKKRAQRAHEENPAARLEPTRVDALAALTRGNGKSVKLFDVRVLAETVCLACGMIDSPSVCRTCPVPRLLLGIVGRAN